MKAEILELLRSRQEHVSGQELAERFGVSRNAVWKAVESLKKEGYDIEAVRNRGYLLNEADEVYGRDELVSRLHTKWAGCTLRFFAELGSTNAQAKIEAEDGAPHGTLVVTDMQTAGRGRRGKQWSSPAATNLYFSIVLRPQLSPNKAPMLTLVMAHSVAEGIRRITGLSAGIKWPNDIVISGKKVCGILTEMSAEPDYIQHVVIGVGVNVRKQAFEGELARRACCLEQECGFQVSRGALLAVIMEQFEKDYECFMQSEDMSGLMESYCNLLVNRGREVCVLDPAGEYRGVSRGITPGGELLVELPDGRVRQVYAGEVSVRGIYGYV